MKVAAHTSANNVALIGPSTLGCNDRNGSKAGVRKVSSGWVKDICWLTTSPGKLDSMEHLAAPLFTVLQATGEGIGLVLLVPILVAPVGRWPREPYARQRLLWLFGLTLPWVLLAYWTSFHWHKDGTPSGTPPLAGQLAVASLAATVLLALAAVILNRGARRFFVAWSLANGWLTAVGALLCIMATGGDWI